MVSDWEIPNVNHESAFVHFKMVDKKRKFENNRVFTVTFRYIRILKRRMCTRPALFQQKMLRRADGKEKLMNDTTFSRKRPGYKLSISQEQSVKNDLQLELVFLLNISDCLKFLLPRALQLFLLYSPNEEKPVDSLGHRSCPRSGYLC